MTNSAEQPSLCDNPYLSEDCGTELGTDGLLEQGHHLQVHVDHLGVPAPHAALAHVALAAGHEAGHLHLAVGGAHLAQDLHHIINLRTVLEPPRPS